MSITDLYSPRISHFQTIVAALERQSNLISKTRLLVFLIAILWTWSFWLQPVILLVGLLVLIVLFLYLVNKNKIVDKELIIQRHLLFINLDEQKIISGDYSHRPKGDQYLAAFHQSENDLDLYGAGSLYQYIHRTQSDQGSEAFAKTFIYPFKKEEILARQEAIKELIPMIDWRQRLIAIQSDQPIRHQTQELLLEWIKSPELSTIPSYWKIWSVVMPCVSIVITIGYAFDWITNQHFSLFVLASFAALVYFAKQASDWFRQLTRIAKELNTLLPCMLWIEKMDFKSSLLKTCTLPIRHPHLASLIISSLNKTLARFDFRMNPIVFIPLNFLVWWDLQQILALDRWRKRFNGNIHTWFDTLADLEELCSYAQLAFNKPNWAFPEIKEDWFVLEAKALAHPLIAFEKAIVNDFTLQDPNRLALVTGSNMAGKSTFLRSVGANIILASAGAPVCAAGFKMSVTRVLTSMRISDNLQEETSTFYAELKKIKTILDAVKAREHVVILIDEMLRGTNAEDRRLGSHGLIHQLIKLGAVGIIASHDTGLSSFKDLYSDQVRNYFFDSYINGDHLKFDYTLKAGVCTSANASFLMKKIGIELG